MPITSSRPSTWTFVGVFLATKMERGALVPLYCLRPRTSVGPSLSQRTAGPDHRDRPAPPRGCRLAPTGGTSGPTTSGSSGTRWIEPAPLGCSATTILRPARNPVALASRTGGTEMDLLARTAWTTADSSGHGLFRPSSGQREPDLGISLNPRGAGHDGRSARSFERVGNPTPTWHRTCSSPIGPNLGGVPANADNDFVGLRLLHRRHGSARTPLRAVPHRDRHSKDPLRRRRRQPSGGVGRPACPQPHLGSRQAPSSCQVPHPGQRPRSSLPVSTRYSVPKASESSKHPFDLHERMHSRSDSSAPSVESVRSGTSSSGALISNKC